MKSRIAVSLRPLFQAVLTICALFVAALFVAACSSMSGNVGNGMGSVTTMISDPATCATPNGPFNSVWVTVTDVQANISSSAGANDSGWVDLTPSLKKAPKQVNLLGIANNQCFLANLGDAQELQAGTYQQIRVILASDSTGISANNCGNGAANCVQLTSDMSFHTLNLSSEAQTGIKIPAGQISNGGLTVQQGKTVDLDIDFMTCESIVQEGNGQYRLKPVLHAGEVSTTSASMNGKVVDANGPIDGAMISLEQKNTTGTDVVVASAATGADGSWVICPLVQGDPTKPYDVVITGVSSTGALYAPSIVTGVMVGDTVGTVTLNLPTGALANFSSATLSGQVSSNSPVAIDVALSALESVNSVNYTIPLPILTGQSSAYLSLETSAQTTQNPACASGTYCVNYQMILPSSGAYIGAWAAAGPNLLQPAPLATYVVDGEATGTTSAGADCTNPSMQQTVTLTGAGPFAPTVPSLAYSGCM